MDRKAFRNCGAVLASLGAVLSAGCGAQSDSPPISAPTASLPAATQLEQQAVVVSPAASSRDVAALKERAAAESVDVGSPVEVVAIEAEPSPLAEEAMPLEAADDTADAADPYAEYAQDEWPSDAEIEAAAPIDEAPLDSVAAALEPQGVDEPVAQSPASEGSSEIRFAGQGVGAQHPAAEQHPSQPQSKSTATPLEAAAPAAQEPSVAGGEKPTLTPVLITPRAMPQPGVPDDVDETPVAENPLVAQQPPVAAQPAPAPPGLAVEAAVAPEAGAAPVPTPLPPVKVARSPAMTAAIARVQERVRHGIQLADKGALYASRREFTTAIKMLAQAQDVEQKTRQHTRAAINGFVALREANDFVGQTAELADVNVEQLVAGHKTTVLKEEDLSDMPSTVAAGHYFNYAKDQLAEAIGHETIGSIALYGLGKIVVAGAGDRKQQLEYLGPAMALFQASLICEPDNFRAAHELGVMLATSGQLEMARNMLIESVRKSPEPVIWRNLATVHARLGEQQLAQQAQQQAAVMLQANPESKAPPVEWVDPDTFARTVSATDPLPPPARAAAPVTQPQSTPPAGEKKQKEDVARKRLDKWNPLNLRR